MTLEATFRTLSHSLQTFHESLVALRLMVVEDVPQQGEAALRDLLSDAADDLLGWLDELRDTAQSAQQSAESRYALEKISRSMARCQTRLDLVEYKLFDLSSYRRISLLLQLGRQQGGEWLEWSEAVHTALEECQQPLFETKKALFDCWQETLERAIANGLSVQTTAVGMQVVGDSAIAK